LGFEKSLRGGQKLSTLARDMSEKNREILCTRTTNTIVLVDKYERHPPSRNRSKLSIQKYETDIICLKQKCMSCTTNTILSFDKYERHPLKGQVKTVHPKI